MATASEVISLALKEIGTVETPTNMNPYGKELGQNGIPWCGIFVACILNRAGMGKPSFNYASAAAYAYAAEHNGWGTYHSANSGYIPRKGDLFVRGYTGSDHSSDGHVGFVAEDSSGNGYFVTVEGNSGANSDCVYQNKGKSVAGLCFVTPPYSAEASSDYGSSWIERDLPNLTTSQMAVKTYEAYQMITNKATVNYKLVNSAETTTNQYGFRVYKNKYYMIALGTYYGMAGTFVKLQFSDGTIIEAVMGDEKSDNHTDSRHMYSIPGGINFLEIIIDGNDIKSQQQFIEQCDKTGIPSKLPVVKICTSDTEPQSEETSHTEEPVTYNFSGTDTRQPIHPRLFNQAPMECNGSIKMIIGKDENNVTAYMGDLSWSNTIAELATTMTFSLSKTDARYNKEFVFLPSVGDIVRYGIENEKFRGIILDCDDGDKLTNKYTAVDAGWYLNKTSDTYQFTEQDADECIRYILERKLIPVAELPELNTKITQIYIDKSISDIIKDILEKCGGGFNFDFIPEGIRIYKCGAHEAKPVYSPASNIAATDSIEIRGAEEHKTSMENMITATKVTSDTDVLVAAQNSALIAEYGLIQTVIKKSDEEDALTLGVNTVRNGGVLDEEYSFEILERLDGYTRAGDSVVINNIKYIVNSSDHSISKGKHQVRLTLKKAESIPLYKEKVSAVVLSR